MQTNRVNRRRFVAMGICALAGAARKGLAAEPTGPKLEDGTAWYNPRDWGVLGKGWTDTEHYYDRLPAKAKGVVRAPVRRLRRNRPDTPIVLVEGRSYANTPFLPSRQRSHAASYAALRAAYDRLTAAGVKGLHYVEGKNLLGDDGDGTVDGSHPNDLGMMRLADALEPVLQPLLPRPEHN